MGVCECIVTCVAIVVIGMVLTVLIMCLTDKGRIYMDEAINKEEEQVLTEQKSKKKSFFSRED